MDVSAFLDTVQRSADYQGQMEHIEILPDRPGRFQSLDKPLPDALQRALAAGGIEQLYVHQAAAVAAARAGRDLVVVTGTASGKTLCYHLPVLEECLRQPASRALMLFPTKALAQDQLRGLLELTARDESLAQAIRAGVYDGDTPTAQRRRIKAEANVVLSNPDMLHASIMPYHPKWSAFFSQLKYIVLDEVHMYRGILGANVACVLRRLDRICRHYGASPQYLAASATIANPGELFSRLIGRPGEVIDGDGSPRGRKYFVLWNPTPLGRDALARRSSTDDAVWLFVDAITQGGQALTFTRTRQAAELVHRYAQDALRARRSPHAEAVRAYRGGYLPHERRAIESDLFAGRLHGVAATNALELGIDVGSLDVTLLVNYPGSFASVWQQAGRSGRRHAESLSVLIAGNDPIDQYLMRHPAYFFAQSPEHAVVDPENPYILANHLRAAAFELPLDAADTSSFGELAEAVADILCEANELTQINGRYYASGGTNPAQRIGLRHMSDDTFSIILVTSQAALGMPDRLPRVAAFAQRYRATQPTTGERPRDELSQHFEVIANVDAISAPS